MPLPYYALASAGLWAVSAQVLSAGLARLPRAHRSDALLAGLLLAQLSGAMALGLVVTLSGHALPRSNWPSSVLAGVLSFPLATGLYYLTGARFGDRAEVAAQFAKVKPVFSLLLAVLVLGEPVALLWSPAALLILAGVALFMLAGLRRQLATAAIGYGLLTALCWSLGELCMGIAADGTQSLARTLLALLGGLAVSLPLLAPAGWRAWRAGADAAGLWPFGVHGVLSFAAGYACFFHSIGQIGLAASVLITACWPLLALLIAQVGRHRHNQAGDVPPVVWVASLCLLAGSISHLWGL